MRGQETLVEQVGRREVGHARPREAMRGLSQFGLGSDSLAPSAWRPVEANGDEALIGVRQPGWWTLQTKEDVSIKVVQVLETKPKLCVAPVTHKLALMPETRAVTGGVADRVIRRALI